MAALVIDTVSRFCSVCVFDAAADAVLAAREDEIGRGHAERLMDVVAQVMAEAGTPFDALTGITVTIGPGSFTGIRVGVAAARGFALALGIPANGVTTLESLAVQAVTDGIVPGPFAVAIKGGRGQVFMQHFDADGVPRGDAAAVGEAEAAGRLSDEVRALVGDAAPLMAPALDPPLPVALERPVGVIAAVARAGRRFSHPPSPLYLRAADAKPQTGFALPRTSAGAHPS